MNTPENDALAARSIRLEVEVPGTPEEVWKAIATGPGIASWFVPAELAEQRGGAVTFHLGEGMDSTGVVTAWEPPHRIAYEERDWMPGAPPLATEFLVEAGAGGTCVVRLVSSLFTSSADWDDQLKGMESGWPWYLQILRLVLTRFPGQRRAGIQVTGSAPGPEERAWAELIGALGLAGAAPGERAVASAPGAPALAGVVARVGEAEGQRGLLLSLDQPAPGVAMLGTCAWGDRIHASVQLYLFGDRAPAVVARDEPIWRAWMAERFPAASVASEARTSTS